MESATQAVWHTVRTIVMDLLIDVDEAEEDHGQWMYTSLEDVCFVFICLRKSVRMQRFKEAMSWLSYHYEFSLYA